MAVYGFVKDTKKYFEILRKYNIHEIQFAVEHYHLVYRDKVVATNHTYRSDNKINMALTVYDECKKINKKLYNELVSIIR